jgi:NADH dehydrogenase
MVMRTKRILVLGGGFAGLWSAVGAARKLDEIGEGRHAVEVTLVNRDAFHGIRVRNYERDLTPMRVPLDDVLGPIGVGRVEGEVTAIDTAGRSVTVMTPCGEQTLSYDRLVYALGSQVFRPPIPGLAEHGFDVDTYDGAARLDHHLQSLPRRCGTPGQYTVVVVGAGLTGIEAAAEMPARLRAILQRAGDTRPVRVVLADHSAVVGSDMGASARPVIEEALASLGVETRLGVEVVAITETGIRLAGDDEIATPTVVWCAGMRANARNRFFPAAPDRCGRIRVDAFMRVEGVADVFAAGDVAWALMDDTHASVMSCQHARPMGRFAGHNVICDLLNLPMLALRIDWYTTILDLGAWGAVYTEGWDRIVVAKGERAKQTKMLINGRRIYPPLTRNRREILDAAAPTVQSPPKVFL